MRKSISPAVSLGLSMVFAVAFPLLAEEPGTRQLSFFLSDIGYEGGSGVSSHHTGGGGLALSYWQTGNLSYELSVSREQYQTHALLYDGNGVVIGRLGGLEHTTPIDFDVRYHFNTEGRWQPYIGIGAHYLHAPRSLVVDNRFGPEAAAGVFFRISPRLRLQLGARQLLSSNAQPSWDPGFRPIIGLSWKF